MKLLQAERAGVGGFKGVRVFVPRERASAEARVAATPETIKKLVQTGFDVQVESGAGLGAHISDADFTEAGAGIVVSDAVSGAFEAADLCLKVAPFGAFDDLGGAHEGDLMRTGGIVVGLLEPFRKTEEVERLRDRKVTSFSMELIPRVSRAQAMDALSSQASIGGYKAVLLAAARLDRYFPLLMTAAGTVKPSRVVILGAGVAGLQAIATARRLGAIVEVSDIRPETKEQVESLGAKFIDFEDAATGAGTGGYAKELGSDALARQREVLTARLAEADVAITTAQVPGKKAPVLITADMVRAMRSGSVVVDLAVEQGGNCALSEPGKEVDVGGVLVLGPRNVPASLPLDASRLYARNVLAFVNLLAPQGELKLDLGDEVVAGALLTHEGRICAPAVKKAIEGDNA